MNGRAADEWQPDPILRLRALAAALPGAVVAERTVDAAFEHVWSVVADLEGSVPRYEPRVERLRIVGRDGGRLTLQVDLVDGRRQEMRARLDRGWCLMQSEESVIAMAARPQGTRTVVAHLEHSRTNPARDVSAGDAHRQQEKLLQEIAEIERLAARLDGDR